MKRVFKPSLRIKIGLLVFFLVILSISISGGMLVEKVFSATEKELGQRALSIARTVARIEPVIQNVGLPGGSSAIQPIAEDIRLATNVEYIVVYDMNRVRYSHPVPAKIGSVFTGGDEGPSLAEHAYVSRAYGIKGPSIRAFVPVMHDAKQVGVVVVGIIAPTYIELFEEYGKDIQIPFFIALIVGLAGAVILSYNIKKQMFNMEPVEIAKLLEERIAVFQSIGEGVIAIDANYQITVANPEACRILNLSAPVIGRSILEVIPDSHLTAVMQTGIAQYNQDRIVGGARILISILPIKIEGAIVGAAATFRDKTEVFNLAKELTGVKQFIEALRVQNHEHRNKLHAIAGLIQLGKSEQALSYVFDVVYEQEELASFLTNNIHDHSISGLLLGKVSRAKELGIQLHIERGSSLKEFPAQWDVSILLAVLGNLLENSMEALQGQPLEERRIDCGIYDLPDCLKIVVEDNGPGIPEEFQDKIYEQGFTTKAGKNRGIGLALIYRYVENAGGNIQLETEPRKGTRFIITIPKQVRREENEDGAEN